jgi:hypothetical protein
MPPHPAAAPIQGLRSRRPSWPSREHASITHRALGKNKKAPAFAEALLFLWRRRADLNRWLYGFANRSLGPLGHVSEAEFNSPEFA